MLSISKCTEFRLLTPNSEKNVGEAETEGTGATHEFQCRANNLRMDHSLQRGKLL